MRKVTKAERERDGRCHSLEENPLGVYAVVDLSRSLSEKTRVGRDGECFQGWCFESVCASSMQLELRDSKKSTLSSAKTRSKWRFLWKKSERLCETARESPLPSTTEASPLSFLRDIGECV